MENAAKPAHVSVLKRKQNNKQRVKAAAEAYHLSPDSSTVLSQKQKNYLAHKYMNHYPQWVSQTLRDNTMARAMESFGIAEPPPQSSAPGQDQDAKPVRKSPLSSSAPRAKFQRRKRGARRHAKRREAHGPAAAPAASLGLGRVARRRANSIKSHNMRTRSQAASGQRYRHIAIAEDSTVLYAMMETEGSAGETGQKQVDGNSDGVGNGALHRPVAADVDGDAEMD